ncbi:MAG: hypothetical protein ACM3JJ_07975 [Hyphomicrobiales bacterium]
MTWSRFPRGGWIAVLLGVVLAAPGLGLGYFWDNFHFLTRAAVDPTAFLLPQAGATFYRPITQGLVFLFLQALGPAGAFAGHLLNLALFALAIALTVRAVARLAGERAGVLAGLVLGASSCMPALVAWISAVQDLGAVVLVMFAFRLRDQGRIGATAAAAAAALLCKETALVVFPALVLWDLLLGRPSPRTARATAWLGAVAVAWAAIHPGLHALAAHGFRYGASGYVGFEEPGRWIGYAARYVLTAMNVPFATDGLAWPGRITVAFLAALALLALGVREVGAGDAAGSAEAAPGAENASPVLAPRRAAALAAWIALPAIALPSVLVRPWGSYFVAIPAIGVALLASVLLARLKPVAAGAVLACFLTLGVLARGQAEPGRQVWTERTFVDASRAARRVEASFRELEPSLPPGAHVLVSVGATGTLGLYGTIHQMNALRVWYREPSLVTLSPERRRRTGAAEFLFRVTPGLTVIEIDPKSGYFRASGGKATLDQVALPMRAYARGLAATGEPERAAETLERLAKLDPPPLASYDLRVAAMALRFAGLTARADSLRAAAPPLAPHEARDMVGQILVEPTDEERFDALAWWGFGVSPSDPDALRYLIGQFRIGGYDDAARAMARRLAAIAPGDSLARYAPR